MFVITRLSRAMRSLKHLIALSGTDRRRHARGTKLAAAKARGKLGGRKPSYTDHQARTARSLHAQGELTAEEIGRVIGVSRATVYRMLKDSDQAVSKPVRKPRTVEKRASGTLASDEDMAAPHKSLSSEVSTTSA